MLPLLALSLLPLTALAHGSGHSHANSRKTVNFHPHPHRSGRTLVLHPPTDPPPTPSLGGGGGKRSFGELARAALADQGEEGKDWFVRNDSYTDRQTRTTHVFVRQLVDGLEVADGDANLNFGPDGRLLSSGNSFYRGPPPSSSLSDSQPTGERAASPYARHCGSLIDRLTTTVEDFQARLARLTDGERADHLVAFGHGSEQQQVTLGLGGEGRGAEMRAGERMEEEEEAGEEEEEEERAELERASQAVKELGQLVRAMCPSTSSSSEITTTEGPTSASASAPVLTIDEEGAARAVLAFLALVHPDESVGRSLRTEPDRYLETLTVIVPDEQQQQQRPLMPPTLEIRNAPGVVGIASSGGVRASLAYLQTDERTLELVWRLELEMLDNWYEGAVGVERGEVLAAVDWARDAPSSSSAFSRKGGKNGKTKDPKKGGHKGKKDGNENKVFTPSYRVWPLGINDPSVGNRSVLRSPHDGVASPAGWHAIPVTTSPFLSTTPGVEADPKHGWVNTTTTLGNNVFAQENWEGQGNWLANYRPVVGRNGSFDFPYGEEEGLRPKEYADLAITELFYTCNMFHDLTYRWGFDELAGNFQEANFGKGGKGADAVIANAQDGSGTNNANFATPPDGQHGRMRMYVWDTATPYRDGDLEAGIVIHEYAHGVSTRLTGGPANSGCLGWGEAGGMGEGWGDFFATQIRKTREVPSGGSGRKYPHVGEPMDFPMGAWAANRAGGIRNYPYSLNATVNPSTYKTLDKGGYFGVHAIGEVWAQFLFVMTENLIAKHGFSTELFPPVDPRQPNDYYAALAELDPEGELVRPLVPKHGNTLALQLVMNGMKLQPCRPSFFDARDAIVQADAILTGGANACEIWSAFADHGLGPDAALRGATPWGGGIRVEDYALPKGVCKDKKKGE